MSIDYDAGAKIYLEASKGFDVIKPKFGKPYLITDDATPFKQLQFHKDISVLDGISELIGSEGSRLVVRNPRNLPTSEEIPLDQLKLVEVIFRYDILKVSTQSGEELKNKVPISLSLSDLEKRITEGKKFLVTELGKCGIEIRPENIASYLTTFLI